MYRLLIAVCADAALALFTGAIGTYGISSWGGEGNAHWLAYFGLPFLVTMLRTKSIVLGAVVHWVACTLLVTIVWWIVRIVCQRVAQNK